MLPGLRILNFACSNQYEILSLELKQSTITSIANLQCLSFSVCSVGWEEDSHAYIWLSCLHFNDLQHLTLHIHHEVEGPALENLLMQCHTLKHLTVVLKCKFNCFIDTIITYDVYFSL